MRIDPRDFPQRRPFRLGFLLQDVSRLCATYLDRALSSIGLTHSQCSVLLALSARGDTRTIQTDLATAMDLGKATLVGLLDRLESKGYVARQADPSSRRNKYVTLTDDGRRMVATIERLVKATNAKIVRDISATDLARGEEFLSRVKSHLIELGATSR